MTNTWKDIDKEQLTAAPPSTCKYCGEPIYWETLPKGRMQPVDATSLRKRHHCIRETAQAPKTKEAKMPTSDQTPLFAEAPSEKKAAPLNKTEAHIQYKLSDGTHAPGVTTILGVYNSREKQERLMQWSWNLGQQGLGWREVRDGAADVGTLAHYLIMCHLKGETPDAPGYSSEDFKKANNCVAKFLNWLKEHPSLKPVMIEEPLISEEFKYGGTLDLFAELGGEFVLIDFKTGKAIYDEMYFQLAAYRKLLEEQGWPVANARILRIGVDKDEGFEERIKANLQIEWDVFWHCLCIYRIRQAAK